MPILMLKHKMHVFTLKCFSTVDPFLYIKELLRNLPKGTEKNHLMATYAILDITASTKEDFNKS